MKIKVEILDWNAFRNPSARLYSREFDQEEIETKKEIIVDFDDYEEYVEKKLFGFIKFRRKVLSIETRFSFRMLDKIENGIILELRGDAGLIEEKDDNNQYTGKWIPRVITLKYDESQEFRTPTKDAGSDYTITLLKY